ncbi:MAG TPA: adenylate/guanylate cyclase domain-containing protein [Acidimicrobiia bacterium]
MTDQPGSAAGRLEQLISRLLAAGEKALGAGEWHQARATAEDILTVDPGNVRAEALARRAASGARPPEGQRGLVSVLFSDLVDSTPMAESVEPEVVRDLFAHYREVAEEAIARFGGKVVQFLGDGIVAAFGLPQPHEDDARRAVRAGMALLDGMHHVARVAAAVGVDALARVGIHTGMVVVADLGGQYTIERDAMVGVAPNLASRLQSEADPGMVVVSDVTRHLVETDFELRSLGLRSLRGIAREVEVFAVVRERPPAERLETARERIPIFGRQQAAASLTSLWDEVVGGSGPVAATLVLGEAGIGKSRLVAELRAGVVGAGGDVIELACLPYFTNSALWPAGRMMERALGIRDDTTSVDRLGRLEANLVTLGLEEQRLVPLLAPVVGAGDQHDFAVPELDPSALRQLTLDAVIDWLAEPSDVPCLFLAEDLHWADPTTLDLLGKLSEHPRPELMAVMTSRHQPEVPWLGAVEEMPLERLGNEAALALVGAIAGNELSAATRDSIVARGEGIPLFLEELTRSALAEPGSENFPLRLQELLTARLRGSDIDLALAQLAATIGQEFDRATIAAVVGPSEDLSHRLEGLVAVGVVVPTGDIPGEGFRFRHALLRDAAYETQVLDLRRATHARVAEALQAAGGGAALVAHHVDQSGAAEDAVTFYLIAAQQSQAVGAHEEATRLLTRALHLVAGLAPGPQHDLLELNARMLRSLSVSSVQGYAAPQVSADFQRSEELSQRLSGVPQTLPSIIAIWSYSLVHGDLDAAQRQITRLLALAGEDAGSWFAPEVEGCAGFQAMFEGDLGRARRHFERALEGFDSRPAEEMVSAFWPLPNDPVAVSAAGLSVVMTLAGDEQAGARWRDRAIGRAMEVPFPRGPFTLAFVDVYLAWLNVVVGDRARAQSYGAEAVSIGSQHGFSYWMALGAVYEGFDRPDARKLREAMAVLTAIGHEAYRPAHLGYLAQAEAEGGDRHGALKTLDEALALAEESGERLHLPELLILRAGLNAAAGDVTQVLADLERAHAVARDQGSHLLALRAANAVARLPADVRPDRWHATVAEALAQVGIGAAFREVAEARSLLA